MKIRPLSDLENTFVEEYCRLGDAIEAVYRMDPSGGYTEHQAKELSASMMKRPQVKQALADRADERTKSLNITPEKIMIELAAIAFSDFTDFIQNDEASNSKTFRIRNPDSIDPAKRKAIKKITERTTREGLESTVELHSKMQALDRLCKIMGLDKGLPSVMSEGDQGDMSDSEAGRLYAAMMRSEK